MAEAETVKPAASRLEYIDGVRALAALWVAVHHIIETAEPEWAMSSPLLGPIVISLFFGQFPVMVFLMLSGFCLYYPYARKATRPSFSMSFRSYLARRWTRIAPPYFWAGFFCLGFLLVPAAYTGRWAITGPIDGWVLLSHLTFVHNLIPDHAVKIDYPMWSIGLEFQLYLLFPLLVGSFRRWGAVPSIGACLLVAAAIRGTHRQLPDALGAALHAGPFSYLEIFAVGMLAAQLTAHNRPLPFRPWMLKGGAVIGFAAIRLGSGNGLVHDIATAGAFFCVLMLARTEDSKIRQFLDTPWLVRVGFFSYSLYLVHAPLVHLGWLALRPLHLQPDIEFLVLTLVGLPLIIWASYWFHRFFELPFMRKKAVPQAAPVGELAG